MPCCTTRDPRRQLQGSSGSGKEWRLCSMGPLVTFIGHSATMIRTDMCECQQEISRVLLD